jgi:catechol 2,3-dioxygenase-like lactoylglutathione lyase family enzyme
MANPKYGTLTEDASNHASARVDMKLEVIVIPVSDVDRAKEFYARLGWRLDADFAAGDDWRVVQFTPPGSGCSIIFGKNVTPATPGSAQGLYLIVSNIEAARDELLRRGVEASKVFHSGGSVYAGPDEPYLFGRLRVTGPDPEHRSYQSYVSFSDLDGNGWLLQEVTTRLPGRIDAATTTFASANDLASALRRARKANRAARRELAGLVRRVHGGGADWRRAATVNLYDLIVIGGGTPREHCIVVLVTELLLTIYLVQAGTPLRRRQPSVLTLPSRRNFLPSWRPHSTNSSSI